MTRPPFGYRRLAARKPPPPINAMTEFQSNDLGWVAADHACRTCGGRLMRNRDNVFWCPGCGVESKVTDGAAPISICGCGINMGPAGTFRCVVNPERSASSPYIIVVASNADAIKAPDPKP